MNDAIVNTWNSTVADDDRVIVVGDLTAGLDKRYDELQKIIKLLRGQKTLVLGNHDHMSTKWYRSAGFITVSKHMFEDNILFVHKPAQDFNPQSLILSNKLKPKLVVHGHVHRKDPDILGHFNVAWDRHERLISLDEIINVCEHEINDH